MTRVTDEDLAKLRGVALASYSVMAEFERENNRPLARVIDELLALRKVADAGEARERRRIRRLIAPHLQLLSDTVAYLRRHGHVIAGQEVADRVVAIDAATHAPKKGRTK